MVLPIARAIGGLCAGNTKTHHSTRNVEWVELVVVIWACRISCTSLKNHIITFRLCSWPVAGIHTQCLNEFASLLTLIAQSRLPLPCKAYGWETAAWDCHTQLSP